MSNDINKKIIDMNDENFVPVKPAKTYKVPYVADPIEFMVYGDRSLDTFAIILSYNGLSPKFISFPINCPVTFLITP